MDFGRKLLLVPLKASVNRQTYQWVLIANGLTTSLVISAEVRMFLAMQRAATRPTSIIIRILFTITRTRYPAWVALKHSLKSGKREKIPVISRAPVRADFRMNHESYEDWERRKKNRSSHDAGVEASIKQPLLRLHWKVRLCRHKALSPLLASACLRNGAKVVLKNPRCWRRKLSQFVQHLRCRPAKSRRAGCSLWVANTVCNTTLAAIKLVWRIDSSTGNICLVSTTAKKKPKRCSLGLLTARVGTPAENIRERFRAILDGARFLVTTQRVKIATVLCDADRIEKR